MRFEAVPASRNCLIHQIRASPSTTRDRFQICSCVDNRGALPDYQLIRLLDRWWIPSTLVVLLPEVLFLRRETFRLRVAFDLALLLCRTGRAGVRSNS